jgi:hypothetical protein
VGGGCDGHGDKGCSDADKKSDYPTHEASGLPACPPLIVNMPQTDCDSEESFISMLLKALVKTSMWQLCIDVAMANRDWCSIP